MCQLSIYNSFPVIRTQVQKNRSFHVLQPTFLFPLETPYITQYVPWMERKFNACQTPRSMYLSTFSSFRVIRCFSQCVSPKIAIFNTFLFPLGMPLALGQSRSLLYGWKENSMLTNCLAECAHVTITVSQIERDIGRKSSFFHSTPLLGGSRRISAIPFGTGKTRMAWLHVGEKNSKISYSFWRKFGTQKTLTCVVTSDTTKILLCL